MEFDLHDLNGLENYGQDSKMNRHPKEPMGKEYTKIQIDSLKLFKILYELDNIRQYLKYGWNE